MNAGRLGQVFATYLSQAESLFHNPALNPTYAYRLKACSTILPWNRLSACEVRREASPRAQADGRYRCSLLI